MRWEPKAAVRSTAARGDFVVAAACSWGLDWLVRAVRNLLQRSDLATSGGGSRIRARIRDTCGRMGAAMRGIDSRRSRPLACLPGAVASELLFLAAFGVVVLVSSGGLAVEPGDVDGDGSLTIRDVVRLREGLPIVDGALDVLQKYPCFDEWSGHPDAPAYTAGAILLEAVRRSVPDPLPHWVAGVWPDTVPAIEPLPPDPRVLVECQPVIVPGGPSDLVRLEIRVTTVVPIRAFALLLEGKDGVLRVRFHGRSFWVPDSWLMSLDGEDRHGLGDWPVRVNYASHMISRGRYVITYGLEEAMVHFPGSIPPGEHSIVVEARLPLGTRAGEYPIDTLQGSRVLLEDHTLAAPTIGRSASIRLLADVTSGYDGGIPPLRLDPDSRRVLGAQEFRVTHAEGLPGETVRVAIEFRTEVPVNRLSYRLTWPRGTLACASELRFANPEDGRLYEPDADNGCGIDFYGVLPNHYALFGLAGGAQYAVTYPDRPMEYFQPLNEWTEVAILDFTILEGAGGGTEIPLTLSVWKGSVEDATEGYGGPPQFVPYSFSWPCSTPLFEDGTVHHNWGYDEVTIEQGSITVLGHADPVPPDEPSDPGLRLSLGTVEGSPGDLVDVPLWASVDAPAFLYAMIVVLETDPAEAIIEAVNLDFVHPLTGDIVPLDILRGSSALLKECEVPSDPRTCKYGEPQWVVFWRFSALEPRFAFVQISPGTDGYLGTTPRQLGVVRVRVPEGFEGDSVRVRHSAVPAASTTFDLDIGSGVWPATPPRVHVPAVEARDGEIIVWGARFVRGDTTGDRAWNLTDAVLTLEHLFRGGPEPGCRDAADVDDNGRVNLTDPILLLRHLFLGAPPPPLPGPDCGVDSTPDELRCDHGAVGC